MKEGPHGSSDCDSEVRRNVPLASRGEKCQVSSMEDLHDEYPSSSRQSITGSESVQSLLSRGHALLEELCSWGAVGGARLQKLVRAELSFLSRLASIQLLQPASSYVALRSSNFNHLEEVFRILRHPSVGGISTVMQNLALSKKDKDIGVASGERDSVSKQTAHVDIACVIDSKPVWLILSSRNAAYIRWSDAGKQGPGLKERLMVLLEAASADAVKQPKSILLCFTGQVSHDVDRGLREDFHATYFPQERRFLGPVLGWSSERLTKQVVEYNTHEVEDGEWVRVEAKKHSAPWNQGLDTYEIGIHDFQTQRAREGWAEATTADSQTDESAAEYTEVHDSGLCSSPLLSRAASGPQGNLAGLVESDQAQEHSASTDSQELVNLDTTALVALVSEISNSSEEKLRVLSDENLDERFPSMSAFIREQVLSELERPLAPEIERAMAWRQPVVSQYVYDEFSSIASRIGGDRENDRAQKLLQRVRVVPNSPSTRVMSLPLSGKIKQRHKIVFGTGDFLNAPTLTANVSFVRAAREKGLLIAILEHRPRALTGD